jgi:hypothetical protein
MGIVNGYQIGPDANLFGADLRGANLGGAKLEGANLEGANLEGANLWCADLQDANLVGANLTGAHLMAAKLEGAILSDANLTGANLERANLTGAYLTGADLTGAYLMDAYLKGANFSYATLDPAHVPLIEAASREMLASIAVNGGRTPNPGYGRGRTPNPVGCSVTNTYLIVSPKDRGDRRRFVCGNGLSFLLRAGKYLFSKPQSETGPWESVEVAYTSRPVPELFPYEQIPRQRNSRESVYQYVPVEVVDDIIEKNGGISPTGNPGSWG